PMIDGESRYQVIIDMDVPKGEKCLVRLVFYDRYEVEAGSITIRDKTAAFKCPLKTYSYRMQLINGGVNGFHFHSIIIQEIEDEKDGKFKKTI
ncbi:MAG: accessory Sec system protein Asp3, partial [Eubacteriales bacterium]|nr:accessory Sec system protein Asp3 [Eubacteriales bacterium]